LTPRLCFATQITRSLLGKRLQCITLF